MPIGKKPYQPAVDGATPEELRPGWGGKPDEITVDGPIRDYKYAGPSLYAQALIAGETTRRRMYNEYLRRMLGKSRNIPQLSNPNALLSRSSTLDKLGHQYRKRKLGQAKRYYQDAATFLKRK